MKKYLGILESCILFDGIADSDLLAMLGCLRPRLKDCAKGEIIFMEGDRIRELGIVLSGAVQVVKEDFYGSRSIVASIGPSHLFGESFACAEVQALPVSVTAAEKSQIMLIDCHRVTQSCSNACGFHNRLVLNLLQVVARKNLLLNQKVEILSRRSTREKLMTFLMNQAKQAHSREFTIPFDRQALADYLGVERSALSVEIGKLRREGVLESERSRFRLL